MWDADRYLIVETDGWFSRLGDILVIDKREPLNNFSAIGPDGKPGLFLGGVKFTPSYIRDNRLVGYMQALDIVDNAATITNSDLKALAATLKEDSNPVIVIATLKR